MTEQLHAGLHRIEVPLPGNPLKSLNSYVLRTADRNLIIDTGFNMPECLAAMRAGIDELGLDMARTDFFITHHHSDHCGLIHALPEEGAAIYMHRLDAALYHHHMRLREAHWEEMRGKLMRIGYPPDVFEQSVRGNPIVALAPLGDLPVTELEEGDRLRLGDLHLRVVHTPGHTPGHACLYWEEERILFTGDQLLYTISPNITDWDETGLLEQYLDSLRRIGAMDVRLGLAAHRQNIPDGFRARVEELAAHYRARLEEALDAVRARPGINAYEVAARMRWSIRAKSWEDFPPNQKWFAAGEALAHLVCLESRGAVETEMVNGVKRYTAKG